MTIKSPFNETDLGYCGNPARGAALGRRGKDRIIIKLSAPSHWASYLINGDRSGLDNKELAQVIDWYNRMIKEKLVIDSAIDCEDAGFMTPHDAWKECPFGADCQFYEFFSKPNPASSKFCLRRVPLDSGGYDSGGAYWGIDQPLYWYSSDDGVADGYFRAANRSAARDHVKALFPSARFYR